MYRITESEDRRLVCQPLQVLGRSSFLAVEGDSEHLGNATFMNRNMKYFVGDTFRQYENDY